DRGLDRGRAELRRGQAGEIALEAAERRAGDGNDDDGIGHGILLLQCLLGSDHARAAGASSAGRSALPCMAMMVCCINAHSVQRSLRTANTSALVMISVRPGLITSPRATRRSPSAGAIRFILYS